ncbi:MAG: hypothetical protein K2L77_05300, partial [Muribaculaceae bacterium]|nr:hypothetical protein [Muribaculaceae bacterium]
MSRPAFITIHQYYDNNTEFSRSKDPYLSGSGDRYVGIGTIACNDGRKGDVRPGGHPVTEAAYICQEQGIRFFGFRHEQQAGMAAATHGYLTKTPGVLLTVSSLGFLNGLTATANATVNCYPMVQISGSSVREPIDLLQGTYEGLDQLAVAKPLVKAAYRVNKIEDIPTGVVRAFRAAVSGRPGGVYLDIT